MTFTTQRSTPNPCYYINTPTNLDPKINVYCQMLRLSLLNRLNSILTFCIRDSTTFRQRSCVISAERVDTSGNSWIIFLVLLSRYSSYIILPWTNLNTRTRIVTTEVEIEYLTSKFGHNDAK